MRIKGAIMSDFPIFLGFCGGGASERLKTFKRPFKNIPDMFKTALKLCLRDFTK